MIYHQNIAPTALSPIQIDPAQKTISICNNNHDKLPSGCRVMTILLNMSKIKHRDKKS